MTDLRFIGGLHGESTRQEKPQHTRQNIGLSMILSSPFVGRGDQVSEPRIAGCLPWRPTQPPFAPRAISPGALDGR